MTFECAAKYVDPGWEATDTYKGADNSNGVLSKSVRYAPVPSMKVGSYSVAYTVRDWKGNQAQAQRQVNVVDTKAPMITVLGDAVMDHEGGVAYT